jgi:hypothetical protein
MPAFHVLSSRWMVSIACVTLAVSGAILACLCLQPAVELRGQDPGASASTTATTEVATASAVLADWQTPAVALLVSGEMKGYIEPCGCTEGQTGGLARRATLARQLRETRGWNVVGLELGSTMIPERIGRLQTRMKFEFARDAIEGMGYVSLGIGREEAYPRQDELLDISERAKTEPDYGLELLSANVLPYPETPELEITRRFQLIEVPATGSQKSLRIAVTSVFGRTMSEGILSDEFMRIEPPADALAAVLPEMRAARPDLLVLLAQCKTDEAKQLAQTFPEFHLVVAAGGIEEGMLKPETIGTTMFVQVGQKGKQVGVIGYYPQAAGSRLRFENVKLTGERFVNAPELEQMMQHYQDRLRDERPDLIDNASPAAHPSGRTYVGAETCGECHAGSYAKWKSTGHAKALDSLATGRHSHQGHWVDRTWDAECVACHAVGWDPQQALRWEGGYIDMDQTPHLAHNQCENCHGPGSRHVELENGAEATDEEIEAERKLMWLSKETAQQKTCRQCHDGDNDPHFDFETYWPKIEHPDN